MTSRCPSDLALEAHLLDPSASALGPHLAACPACQARLSTLEAQGEDFRRFVYPATVARVEDAAVRRRPGWLAFAAPLVATAALAVVLLRPSTPPGDYLGPKGGPGGVGLTVFAPAAGDAGARPLADGAHVPASAALRFRVRLAARCRLSLLSVDGQGHVSPLHPPSGEAAPLDAGLHDLPGGARLDGLAGPERFYAVCADAGSGELAALARAVAGGGPERVRAEVVLPGLPEGAAQASVLLEKDAP